MSLTRHLLKSGHHSVVAADPRGVLSSRLQAAGFPTVPLRIRNHLDFWAAFQLRRLVRNNDYDIVHFHTARAHALSPYLRRLKAKRIVTRRMDYPLRTGVITRLLYSHSVEKVIAISQGVRSALVAGGIPKSHIRLIPSGVDTARFTPDPAARARVRSQYDIDAQTPLVISVGALVERKGHDLLLATAQQLKKKGCHVRYLICGDGPLRSPLEAQVRTLALSRDVQFTGFCSNIADFLSAADIFIHVPHHEGLGVAVIEALAAGLPTIASKVGGIPEIIEEQKTGLLIPPQNVDLLITSLIRLLSVPTFARQLGKAGQKFVRARFDISITTQANEALYMEVLADTV